RQWCRRPARAHRQYPCRWRSDRGRSRPWRAPDATPASAAFRLCWGSHRSRLVAGRRARCRPAATASAAGVSRWPAAAWACGGRGARRAWSAPVRHAGFRGAGYRYGSAPVAMAVPWSGSWCMAPGAGEQRTLATAGGEKQAERRAARPSHARATLEAKAALDALEQAIADLAVGLQDLLAAGAAEQQRRVEGRPILELDCHGAGQLEGLMVGFR